MAAKRAANPEHEREIQRKHRERNREKINERQRAANLSPARRAKKAADNAAYRQANADAISAYYRDYYEAHREHRIRQSAIRKHGTVNKDYVVILKQDPCSYCGRPMEHIDHIEPLDLGGSNTPDNLTAACRGCNISKGIKTMLEFMLYRLPDSTALGGGRDALHR